jgi:hypothetical protein
VSEEQQIADKVQQMRINQQAKDKFAAMQQPQQEAASSTSRTDFPKGPTMQQLSERDPITEQPRQTRGVVQRAAETLQNMPLQGGQAPQSNDSVASMAQTLGALPDMEMRPPTGPTQQQQPPMTPTGVGFEQVPLQQDYPPQQPQNPGLAPHSVPPNHPNFRPQQPQQPYMSPQGNPYPLGTEESRQWAAQQTWGNRPNITRSFATQVLDEFGDMLHKADPHVAGLLAFRVYMDKVMR